MSPNHNTDHPEYVRLPEFGLNKVKYSYTAGYDYKAKKPTAILIARLETRYQEEMLLDYILGSYRTVFQAVSFFPQSFPPLV
jgi:hypothetical protein